MKATTAQALSSSIVYASGRLLTNRSLANGLGHASFAARAHAP